MNKKVGLVGVLVVLIAISAYMWTTKSTTAEVDQHIAQMKQSYTCRNCGKKFELTVAQARQELRTKHDIICPYCKHGNAIKDEEVLVNAGDGFKSDEPEEEAEEKPKPFMEHSSMGPVRP